MMKSECRPTNRKALIMQRDGATRALSTAMTELREAREEASAALARAEAELRELDAAWQILTDENGELRWDTGGDLAEAIAAMETDYIVHLQRAEARVEAAETTMLRQCMRACREAVEAARARAIRLQEFLEEVDEMEELKVRAEAAEAEAARLREALEKIVNLNPSNWCASWTGGVDVCDTMKLIAQAALSKEAE